MVLRKLGRPQDSLVAICTAQRLDPLDYWSGHEAALIASSGGVAADATQAHYSLASLMRGVAESYLELASDYAACGAWDEASEVLTGFVEAAADKTRIHPMVFYDLAFYADQKQEKEKARRYRIWQDKCRAITASVPAGIHRRARKCHRRQSQ